MNRSGFVEPTRFRPKTTPREPSRTAVAASSSASRSRGSFLAPRARTGTGVERVISAKRSPVWKVFTEVDAQLGDDPAADRDDLVALLGGDVLVARRVDLAHDRHAGVARLGDAPRHHLHVLRIDGLGAGLDAHPDEHDVRAERDRVRGRDHRHAPALAVAPLGGVLGAPVEADHHGRGAAAAEDRRHAAGGAGGDQDRVRAGEPADDRRQVLEPGARAVVEPVVDGGDHRVRAPVEQPGQPDLCTCGHLDRLPSSAPRRPVRVARTPGLMF